MEKLNYETPTIEIIYFETQDIITTSQLNDYDDVLLGEDNF